jgi:type IV pilus assembly protein PilQ
MRRLPILVVMTVLFAGTLPALPADAQRARAPLPCPDSRQRCITVTFRDAEIADVLAAFADFSGFSIVAGAGVAGRVSAEIRNQPWDVALQAILQAHGLEARETHPGLLRVEAQGRLRDREVQEPLVTRVFRINYVPVQELAATLAPLRSERGSISASPATNSLVVTDTETHLRRIAALLGQPE